MIFFLNNFLPNRTEFLHGLAASEGEAGDGWGFNGGRVASAAIADRSGLHMFERGQRGREGGGFVKSRSKGGSSSQKRRPRVSGHLRSSQAIGWSVGRSFSVGRGVGVGLSLCAGQWGSPYRAQPITYWHRA